MLKHAKTVFVSALTGALALSMFPVAAPAQSDAGLQQGASAQETAYAQAATLEERAELASTEKLGEVDRRAEQVVSDYFEARADEVAGKGGVAESDSVSVLDEVAEVSGQRAEGLENMAEQANIEIKDAKTSVQVEAVERDGEDLVVSACEYTVFEYDDLSDGAGGKDTAIFGTQHEIVLEQDSRNGGFSVASDAYCEEDISGVDTSDGSAPDAQESLAANGGDALQDALSAMSLQSADAAVTYSASYDPALAIAYANKYALKYNGSYRNFNPVGGDCANFTSQSINAGGFKQVKGSYSSSSAWYYSSGDNCSSSWIYCPTFVSFFKKHGKYVNITKNNAASSAAVYPGSPVVYMSSTRWSHAVFCVGYNSAGTPIINAHNNDRYHVPYNYWTPKKRCTIQLTPTNGYGRTFTTKSLDGNAGAVSTEAAAANEFTWSTTGAGTVSLQKYNGTAEDVTVSSTVSDGDGKTYSVNAIGSNAFAGTGVRSVTVGASAKTIGANAFKGCGQLESINLNGKVDTVGKGAFRDCSKLVRVDGTAGIAHVQADAFRNCDSLASVPQMGKLATLGARAFYDCDALVQANLSSAKLGEIGASAFAGCDRLATLSGCAKVTSIGSKAFMNCPVLSGVCKFPKLKTLSARAFLNCKALAALPTMPRLKTLGKLAFSGCSALKTANLSSASLVSIGVQAFEGDAALQTVVVKSKKLNTLSKRAFYKCSNLKALTLKTSKIAKKSKVGKLAFKGTHANIRVKVPKSKVKTYKKWFRARGLSKKAKVTK